MSGRPEFGTEEWHRQIDKSVTEQMAKTRVDAQKELQHIRAQLTSGGQAKSGRLVLVQKGGEWRVSRRGNWMTRLFLLDHDRERTNTRIKTLLQQAGDYAAADRFARYASDKAYARDSIDISETLNLIPKTTHQNETDALATLGSQQEGDPLGQGGFGTVSKFKANVEQRPRLGLKQDQEYVLKTFKNKGNPNEWYPPRAFFTHGPLQQNVGASLPGFTKGNLIDLKEKRGKTEGGEWMSVRLDRKPIEGLAHNEVLLVQRKTPNRVEDVVTIRARDLKMFLATQSPESDFRLHAVIQKYHGDTVAMRIEKFAAKVADSEDIEEAELIEEYKRTANSTLKTLAEMIDRGYEHNDIKPDNITYDTQTRSATLIDPGLLTKSSQKDNALPDYFEAGAGSYGYAPAVVPRTKKTHENNHVNDYISGGRSDLRSLVISLKEILIRNLTSGDRPEKGTTVKGVYFEKLEELFEQHRGSETKSEFILTKSEFIFLISNGAINRNKLPPGSDYMTYESKLESYADELTGDKENLWQQLKELEKLSEDQPSKSYTQADRKQLANKIRKIADEIDTLN